MRLWPREQETCTACVEARAGQDGSICAGCLDALHAANVRAADEQRPRRAELEAQLRQRSAQPWDLRRSFGPTGTRKGA